MNTEHTWVSKAQRWMDERMSRAWSAWVQTKTGKWWVRRGQSCRRLSRYDGVSPQSPYAHGFSIPEEVRDMIDALAKHDEERVKAIMLYR